MEIIIYMIILRNRKYSMQNILRWKIYNRKYHKSIMENIIRWKIYIQKYYTL